MVGFQAIGLSNLLTGNAFTHGRRARRFTCRSSMPASCAAQYARATADLDVAVADYNGAVVNAIKQTADAMTQVEKPGRPARAAAGRGDRAPSSAFRIAEDRYRSGLATQLPMLTAEATLLQARQALAGVVARARSSASPCC